MVATVQQKFEVIKMYQQGTPAVEIAKERGVSLRSVFYWAKRFNGSLDSLENKKRGPRNAERKVSEEDEKEILELRVAKGWGYRRIMWYFKRRKGKSLSKNTIRYWIRKHSIPARRRRKHRRRTRTGHCLMTSGLSTSKSTGLKASARFTPSWALITAPGGSLHIRTGVRALQMR